MTRGEALFVVVVFEETLHYESLASVLSKTPRHSYTLEMMVTVISKRRKSRFSSKTDGPFQLD